LISSGVFFRRFDLAIRPEIRVFLRDCYDHTVQLMDLVESYGVLSGLMEIYLSNVSIRTNEIMRVLTVISSVSFRSLLSPGFTG
jgi:Mg2+ and Co2+ transporter CorA